MVHSSLLLTAWFGRYKFEFNLKSDRKLEKKELEKD